ncbi:flagellar biosynthesis repressor FlbT [Beijerinckia sp. L45]|uniref:flagellar biosynthesis repressor FlbT n=1 Tax=Beijerinckia sp. L45 TaxID=1641855 RepID=UPI00131C696C|nr:flagellar biosynthesis repressor FlbT [Beijerinckia sp. L45]
MQITLRPDEKIYINGAVLRVDRKVSIELLNDAAFLLEAHVMSVDAATTPLRQLYFVVQMMLINPNDTAAAEILFKANLAGMLAVYAERTIVEGLQKVGKLVATSRYFDALKLLRGLFAQDDAILANERQMALAS